MKFFGILIAVVMAALIESSQCVSWDSLKVTWGINPFSSFNDMPRTVRDAIAKGWTKRSGCGGDSSSSAIGERYVLGEDESILLIFNLAGEIAGIATHVPTSTVSGFNFPQGNQLKYFDLDGDNYVIQAFFTEPSLICEPGSSSTFNRLIIKSQQSEFEASKNESTTVVAGWTRGECFWSMGQHYWRSYESQLTVDSVFGDFFPGFLLYNKGELNGFGWNLVGTEKWMGTSDRYETPNPALAGSFFSEVPAFFTEPTFPPRRSIHIFFTSNPQFGNRC
jgi:hypothetical protein